MSRLRVPPIIDNRIGVLGLSIALCLNRLARDKYASLRACGQFGSG